MSNQVHVGEAAFAKKPEDFVALAIERDVGRLEVRYAGKTPGDDA